MASLSHRAFSNVLVLVAALRATPQTEFPLSPTESGIAVPSPRPLKSRRISRNGVATSAMTSLAETRIRSLKEAETPITKEPIRDLIHELRQPLSSIEAIAYYLEMTLPANQTQPRRYMRELQQLVDETNTMLKEAAGRLN